MISAVSAVYDTYTKLMLHCDGADNSTVFTDEIGKTITVVGNAKISTAQSKFGGASAIFDGSGDYLTTPANADFAFGTGDYTVDMWAYIITWNDGACFCIVNNSGGFQLGRSGTTSDWGTCANAVAWKITASTLPSTGAWHHIAVSRSGGTERIFLDGVVVASGSNTYNYTCTGTFQVSYTTFHGYIDELRVSKGIARWTSNFTPPTGPYP